MLSRILATLPEASVARFELLPTAPSAKPNSGAEPLFHVKDQLTISNFTGCDITLVNRHGWITRIPAVRAPSNLVEAHQGCLIVRGHLSVSREVDIKNNPHSQLFAPSGETWDVSSYKTDTVRGLMTGENFDTLVVIPYTTLLHHGGSVYDQTCDYVFTVNSYDQVDTLPLHPASPQARGAMMQKRATQHDDATRCGVYFELVDNQAYLGDRFLNMNGTVIRVQAQPDPDREDGLYCITLGEVNPLKPNNPPLPVHYSIQDLTEGKLPIGVYTTYTDASKQGDQLQQLKQQVELQRQELELKKQEAELASHEWSQERKQAERELLVLREESELKQTRLKEEYEERARRAKDESDRRELERKEYQVKLQDHYDHRSYERKDSSETWKFGIALLTLGLTLWKAVK